jgi:hypothetical protein
VCHALLPKLEELVKNRYPTLKVEEIKAAGAPEMCGKYLIFSFPAIILLYNEQVIWKKAGVFSLSEVNFNINKALTNSKDE